MKVIIIGAGTFSAVIIDILLKRKYDCNEDIEIVGLLDDKYDENKKEFIMEIPIIGKISDIENYTQKEIQFIIAIGNTEMRKKIAEKYKFLNYYTAIHPTAKIANFTKIGEGSVICVQSVVNSCAEVGKHCIVNVDSVVGHHSKVDNYSHISAGSILCGGVKVGECSFIGAGTTVIPEIIIGDNVVIGAGTTVIKNVSSKCVVVGNPGKVIKKMEE